MQIGVARLIVKSHGYNLDELNDWVRNMNTADTFMRRAMNTPDYGTLVEADLDLAAAFEVIAHTQRAKRVELWLDGKLDL
jgi:hypothetical protein